MTKITLYQGDVVQVEFSHTGGQFEIHFNSDKHPDALVIKETAGFDGNVKGKALSTLYEDKFVEEKDDSELPPPLPRRFGFFMDAVGKIHCTSFVHCEIVNHGAEASPNYVVETLNDEGEVTGEFVFYESIESLCEVAGCEIPQITI